MKKITLEVCIDNLESLPLAIGGGADRIELCSALALGGLSPTYGMMKRARERTQAPIYAMIRPRQGDFVFDEDDIQIMIEDIKAAKYAKLDGIVIGALTPQGKVNKEVCQRLIEASKPSKNPSAEDICAGEHTLGITFHRAFDQCQDPLQALEDVIELGCERVLTSGLASTALQGVDVLKTLHQAASGRISIMAGAGVNAENAQEILRQTQVHELHLSGKSTRPSVMEYIAQGAKMGASDCDDYQIPVTAQESIQAIKDAIQAFQS